jgi:hypothetical protein
MFIRIFDIISLSGVFLDASQAAWSFFCHRYSVSVATFIRCFSSFIVSSLPFVITYISLIIDVRMVFSLFGVSWVRRVGPFHLLCSISAFGLATTRTHRVRTCRRILRFVSMCIYTDIPVLSSFPTKNLLFSCNNRFQTSVFYYLYTEYLNQIAAAKLDLI